jgi:RNA polymerase sigma factor (sigma-70 family)
MNAAAKQAQDEWIALRCQHGEPEAFGDLVREMERPLLYFAQNLVNDQDKALDVLQEVWLKAFRTIRRLENPRLVRAWLYRLTRGLAIDRVRKDAAGERRERAHAEERVNSDEGPSFDEEDAAAVHRALDTYFPRCKFQELFRQSQAASSRSFTDRVGLARPGSFAARRLPGAQLTRSKGSPEHCRRAPPLARTAEAVFPEGGAPLDFALVFYYYRTLEQ